MSRSNSIKSNLADEGMGSRWADGAQANRKRAGEDEDGAEAIMIFERGVSAIGAQKVAALELGMSDSHLGDHLRGDRTIAFHRIVRLCRRSPDAALVMLAELARIAGLAPPQKIKTELTPAQKKEARRMFVQEIRAVSLIHSAALRRVADQMGTDADALDEALDEVTDVRSFSK